jgi:hypothetical protein
MRFILRGPFSYKTLTDGERFNDLKVQRTEIFVVNQLAAISKVQRTETENA